MLYMNETLILNFKTLISRKRNDAVKGNVLVAPPFENGSDGLFIIFSCPGVFRLNRLQGKLFDEVLHGGT